MTRQEMEQYKDKKPVAVYPMSNWGGVEIMDIIYGIEDYVVCRYNFGGPEDRLHKIRIRCDDDCAYFLLDKTKIRLDECMKV